MANNTDPFADFPDVGVAPAKPVKAILPKPEQKATVVEQKPQGDPFSDYPDVAQSPKKEQGTADAPAMNDIDIKAQELSQAKKDYEEGKIDDKQLYERALPYFRIPALERGANDASKFTVGGAAQGLGEVLKRGAEGTVNYLKEGAEGLVNAPISSTIKRSAATAVGAAKGLYGLGESLADTGLQVVDALGDPEDEAERELFKYKHDLALQKAYDATQKFIGAPAAGAVAENVAPFAVPMGQVGLIGRVGEIARPVTSLMEKATLAMAKAPEQIIEKGIKGVGKTADVGAKVASTPEAQAIATGLVTGNPMLAVGQYVAEKSGALRNINPIRAIKEGVVDTLLEGTGAAGELLGDVPKGVNFTEYAVSEIPKKIKDVENRLESLGSSKGDKIEAGILKAKIKGYQILADAAEKGRDVENIARLAVRGSGSYGATLATTTGSNALLNYAAMPAGTEDAVNQSVGEALAFSAVPSVFAVKPLVTRINGDRAEAAGKKVVHNNAYKDIHKETLATMTPEEQRPIHIFNGYFAESPIVAMKADNFAKTVTLQAEQLRSQARQLKREGNLAEAAKKEKQADNTELGKTARGFITGTDGTIFLNVDAGDFAETLRHEGGHSFSRMSDIIREKEDQTFKDIIKSEFFKDGKPTEAMKRFAENYGKKLKNIDFLKDPEAAAEEAAAYTAQHVLNGAPLEELALPSLFKTSVGNKIKAIFNKGGGIVDTTGSGVPLSQKAIDVFRATIYQLGRDKDQRYLRNLQEQKDVAAGIKDKAEPINLDDEITRTQAENQPINEAASYTSQPTESVLQGTVPAAPIVRTPSPRGKALEEAVGRLQDAGYEKESIALEELIASGADEGQVKAAIETLYDQVYDDTARRKVSKRKIERTLQKRDAGEDITDLEALILARESLIEAGAQFFETEAAPQGSVARPSPLSQEALQAQAPLAAVTPIVHPKAPLPLASLRVQEGQGKKANISVLAKMRPQGARISLDDAYDNNISLDGLYKSTNQRLTDKRTVTTEPSSRREFYSLHLTRTPDQQALLNQAALDAGQDPRSFQRKAETLETFEMEGQPVQIIYNSAKEIGDTDLPTAQTRDEAIKRAELGLNERGEVVKNIIITGYGFDDVPTPIISPASTENAVVRAKAEYGQGSKAKLFKNAADAEKAIRDYVAGNRERFSKGQAERILEWMDQETKTRAYASAYDPEKVLQNVENAKKSFAERRDDADYDKAYKYLTTVGVDGVPTWVRDWQNANENAAYGFRRDGQILRGKDGKAKENYDPGYLPQFEPTLIPDFNIQVLNAIEGGPKAASFELAEANARQGLEGKDLSVFPTAKKPEGQSSNPFFDKLTKDGLQKMFENATEQIRLDRIKSITEGNPNIDILPSPSNQRNIGFMPPDQPTGDKQNAPNAQNKLAFAGGKVLGSVHDEFKPDLKPDDIRRAEQVQSSVAKAYDDFQKANRNESADVRLAQAELVKRAVAVEIAKNAELFSGATSPLRPIFETIAQKRLGSEAAADLLINRIDSLSLDRLDDAIARLPKYSPLGTLFKLHGHTLTPDGLFRPGDWGSADVGTAERSVEDQAKMSYFMPRELNDLAQAAKESEDSASFVRKFRQSNLQDLSDQENHRWGRAISPYKGEPFADLKEIYENQQYMETIKGESPSAYRAIKSPTKNITVWRAIPADAADKIRIGDYVALEKRYADMHAKLALEGEQGIKSKVISATVPKEDVVWGDADWNEYAYSPKKIREFAPSLEEFFENIKAEAAQTEQDKSVSSEQPFFMPAAPGTPEFKKWFSNSKVVDDDGKPLVVYHGTRNEITEFDPEKGLSEDMPSWMIKGTYFTDDPRQASGYAGSMQPANLGDDPVLAFDRIKRSGLPDGSKLKLVVPADKKGVPVASNYSKGFSGWKLIDIDAKSQSVPEYATDKNGKLKKGYHFTVELPNGQSIGDWRVQEGRKPEDARAIAESIYNESDTVVGRSGSNVMPAYLSMQNPLVVDANGGRFNSFKYNGKHANIKTVGKIAQEKGNDGLILKNIVDSGHDAYAEPATTYVAFDSTQIKSATGNSGAFDASNPDIRFMPEDSKYLELAKDPKKNKAELQKMVDLTTFEESKARYMPSNQESVTLNGAKAVLETRDARGNKSYIILSAEEDLTKRKELGRVEIRKEGGKLFAETNLPATKRSLARELIANLQSQTDRKINPTNFMPAEKDDFNKIKELDGIIEEFRGLHEEAKAQQDEKLEEKLLQKANNKQIAVEKKTKDLLKNGIITAKQAEVYYQDILENIAGYEPAYLQENYYDLITKHDNNLEMLEEMVKSLATNLEKALLKYGVETYVTKHGSGLSDSKYIEIDFVDGDSDVIDKITNGNGKIKIRLSDHDLPDKWKYVHGEADLDVRKGSAFLKPDVDALSEKIISSIK